MGSRLIDAKRWFRCAVTAVTCVLGAAPASAQFEDKTCISFNLFSQRLIYKASMDLGFKEVVEHGLEAQFIADLQSTQWDLVGLELASTFNKIQNKTEILDLFKQQHAGGAKFIVSYAHLDEWPELQEFMGLESAVDQPFFLDILPPPPGNPIWFEDETGFEWDFPVWTDHGDYLTPSPSGIVVTIFENGEVATVMSEDRTRLVHGWNFDEYGGGAPTIAVIDMIIFLLGCGADVSKRNGILEIDDFVTFQNFFANGRGPANFDFDDALTVFDFLEFFNQFVFGCPH